MSEPTPYRTPAEPVRESEFMPLTREFIVRMMRSRRHYPSDYGVDAPPSWDYDSRNALVFVGFEIADAIRDLAAAVRERK